MSSLSISVAAKRPHLCYNVGMAMLSALDQRGASTAHPTDDAMRIELPDKTVRDVEAMLAKRGENGNLSEFIDRTLQRTLFFETVREVKRQNAGVDPRELDRLIDEAVQAVRANGTRATPDENGA